MSAYLLEEPGLGYLQAGKSLIEVHRQKLWQSKYYIQVTTNDVSASSIDAESSPTCFNSCARPALESLRVKLERSDDLILITNQPRNQQIVRTRALTARIS